ncbi:28S ribosomal protein s7, mitochondrial [Plakobranchus ocellatus]|uniref:28S ribosomal protein s7, mitochondrial n=1 Tax=Plakobranchus ocellatus TaxID=259542 RepID=A0AAV3ZYB7_9GAST|nr:28S ribosomal protein s7, mitochondrial [Plakobranchus ocellatus]
MAAPFVSFTSKALGTILRGQPLTKCVFPKVHLSVYNPKYVEPVLDKDTLTKGLEDGDARHHMPIKAPTTDLSISPLFYDDDVRKFTNMMMKTGNKERVREITRKLFENIKHMQVEKYNKATTDEERSQIECNPITIFKTAVENCKPLLTNIRVVKGGVAYRVPVCARPSDQRFRAMKWIIESCRDKERRIPMENKLTWEIMDAYNNQGKAVRKKQEVHRICESNRAYAHLR